MQFAGCFDIERELGRGAMATVYLALDRKHDRRVALKVLCPEVRWPGAAERFHREIQLAARLAHPNIVPLFDSGDADGAIYFIMQYVEGAETLRERLVRDGALPIGEAVSLTRDVASALDYAHRQGVVHRDIKPENILLAEGRALVLDFGIARALGGQRTHRSSDAHLVIGTPTYMSPEQASADEQVGPASDLYSLGCVLYEMLGGTPPFTGTTPQKVLVKHLQETPRRLSALRPDTPAWLQRLVGRLLEKDPTRRASQASDVLAALDGPTIRVWPVPRWLVAAALLGLLAAALWSRGPGRTMFASRADPTELAVLYLDAPTGDSALGLLAARITEDLIDDLSRTGAVQVRSAAEVSRIRQAPQRLSVAARTLGAGMLITGRVAGAAELPTVVLRLVDDKGVQLDSRDITDIPVGPGVGWSALRDSVMVVARSWIGKELAERNRLAGMRNVEAWTLVHESDVNRQRARALAEAGDPESASRALDQADSVLRLAARRDTGWLEPLLQRAWLSIDRIDLLERLPAPEVPEITRAGIQLADSVIARKPDPRALEVRGVLLFREALNGRTSSDSLLALAERDLRAAAGPAHPAQARALTELSWVLFERAAAAEALVAAREASRADRLQIESERVLFSLYLTSLTADSVRTAAGACDEGYRRFPKNWLFTFCRLAVMVLPDGRVPEPQSAWRMFDEMGRLAPPGVRPYQSRWRAMVAAVLARAGLEDSARRTLARARKDGDGDVEMPFYDAAARMALGDRKGALASLDIYLQANPGMRHPIRLDPMFQPLRSDVGFQALVAVPDSTGLKE